ncbi:heavy-metal-associated domain-containing protein [Flavobacterium sp.]|jgi:mercuric ion binding protein|uniref:heavy-metal-associated domain-containing protein n=1 Tax=Flavobacterium sp. TaxID=239 RepID=UPI0022C7D1BC|nr:heavy-metal-associated domain-containing protein [Flavobacterium sp.]MCZ8143943.1 heavy-metal-associated domain-containing protein [Flavobacterium sp.]MCZ8367321.1 heavy-metal-associated domain-containing protein [Flavobacterium sp.]
MKKLLIVMVTLLTVQGWAQEKKNKNAAYTIEVNGNCETCKQRIEKAAYAVKGVKSAVWNIETHQLQLIINEEKTTLDGVKKAIAAIGHDVIGSYKAPEGVYENLHHCCKYERLN